MRKLAITLILVSIEEPVYGARPSTEVTVVQNDSLQISGVKWTGKFDSKGCFVAKQKYSVRLYDHDYKGCMSCLARHYIQNQLLREEGVSGKIVTNIIEYENNDTRYSQVYETEYF